MQKIALYNLGCSKNIVDGERIVAWFSRSGYAFTQDVQSADVIVVNTCAFIKEAKEEAIESILDAARYKKEGNCSTLVVAGCFSQRYAEEAPSLLPEVDLWVGVDDWHEALARYLDIPADAPSFERSLMGTTATQYLKISEGCNHRCSFCAIPGIRGAFRSRPPDEIVREAQWLQQQGTGECILVSQDTTGYGKDIGSSLPALLERVLAETTFPWIRMMYLHPRGVTDALLRLVASESRLCSYFDIPLQHIADPILKGMRRKPGAAQTYALIERIRTIVPDAAIRTSFILGFPGETQRHFDALVKFVEWARFEKVGVFPFSPEEGTAAETMRPRPRTDTTQRRCETLMSVQQEISRQILEKRIGTHTDVIIDELAEGPTFHFEGRTQWDAPEIDGRVFVKSSSLTPGMIVPVQIVDASDYDLYGVDSSEK
jgi:ribosomal protein S12 methylthiotransferase